MIVQCNAYDSWNHSATEGRLHNWDCDCDEGGGEEECAWDGRMWRNNWEWRGGIEDKKAIDTIEVSQSIDFIPLFYSELTYLLPGGAG